MTRSLEPLLKVCAQIHFWSLLTNKYRTSKCSSSAIYVVGKCGRSVREIRSVAVRHLVKNQFVGFVDRPATIRVSNIGPGKTAVKTNVRRFFSYMSSASRIVTFFAAFVLVLVGWEFSFGAPGHTGAALARLRCCGLAARRRWANSCSAVTLARGCLIG